MPGKNQTRTPPQPSGPPLELPEGDPRDIPPQFLLLDPQNLRLLEVSEGLMHTPAKLISQASIQDRVYRLMKENPLFDVDALVHSIEYNGFLKHEQLIVAPFDSENYIVLEGNRRLSAVRTILQNHPKLNGLSPSVRESLQTLPCFVLRGPVIEGKQAQVDSYRRASETYIGIRHLMGAKNWEPASRYEFQWRLVNEGWSIEQVAERFGRKIREVKRDLKAQTLYRDYRAFEARRNIAHSITYNAFAEAARAGSIMKWLGWSDATQKVANKEREAVFFSYLITKLRASPARPADDEAIEPAESAEAVVRKLRDMLKLADEDVEGALEDLKFDAAELLYEDRKEGTFVKRLQSFIRALRRTTVQELSQNSAQNSTLLKELKQEADTLLRLVMPSRSKK